MISRKAFIKIGLLAAGGFQFIHCSGKNTAVTTFSMEEEANAFTQEEPGKYEQKIDAHVPKITIEKNDNEEGIVKVELGHEMINRHYIEKIYIKNDQGVLIAGKDFKQGDLPVLDYIIKDEKVITVYSKCNLHGLWKNSKNL